MLCNHPLHLHAHLTSLPLSSSPRLFTSSCLTSLSPFLSLLPCVSYFLLFNPLHSVFHSFSISIPFFYLPLSPESNTFKTAPILPSPTVSFSFIFTWEKISSSLIIMFRLPCLHCCHSFIHLSFCHKGGEDAHTHTLCKGAAGRFRYSQWDRKKRISQRKN